MKILLIVVIGAVVAVIFVIAAVAVGIGEAADSAHSQSRDLAEWERDLVDRDLPRKSDEEREA